MVFTDNYGNGLMTLMEMVYAGGGKAKIILAAF